MSLGNLVNRVYFFYFSSRAIDFPHLKPTPRHTVALRSLLCLLRGFCPFDFYLRGSFDLFPPDSLLTTKIIIMTIIMIIMMIIIMVVIIKDTYDSSDQ